MSDSIVSVYSDARTEYTKQLCVFLVPAHFQFFLGLLERAREQVNGEPKKLLWQFQTFLNDIPEWNMEKVNQEITNIQNACGCDYLEDLLTAVFIAHTKVLTAIRISSKQKKVQITVPKVEHFLFKVLCESSKLLWGSTYLFREGISSIEKQQNYRTIEGLLQEGIVQAVRSLVPVKSILRDFVSHEDDDEEDRDDKEDKEDKDEKSGRDDEKRGEREDEREDEREEKDDMHSEKVNNDAVESTVEPTSTTITDEVAPIADYNVEDQDTIEDMTTNESEQSNLTSEPPIINIDDRPEVSFANFDTVFDSENSDRSDLVYGSRGSPGLEILEESGVPLTSDMDIDDLDTDAAQPLDDYEVLV